MPTRASDRRLLTTTKLATKALEEDLRELRRVVKQDGVERWHVRVLDFKDDPDSGDEPWRLRLAPLKRNSHDGRGSRQPYIAVDFEISENDDATYSILKWSISGFELLSTKRSRFPLRTYARIAILAVEDAIAADTLTYEQIMAQELPYIGSLTDSKIGWVYKEFRIVDGQVDDPRAEKKARPRRRNVSTKSDEIRDRVPRAVEAYRQAVVRGSRSPTVDVAEALNVGRSTAARALAAAREQGLLGPALRNRAGEQ